MLDRLGPLFIAATLAGVCFSDPALGQNSKADKARFSQLVKEATAAYGDGQLRESIKLLKQAYAIKQDPRLLYNIAKAEEGLGNWQKAIDGYRAYLDKDPQASNRDVVAGRITVLEKQLLERENHKATAARLAAERAESAGKRKEAITKYQRYLELAPNVGDRQKVEAKIAELRRPAPPEQNKGTSTVAGKPSGSIAPWLVVGVGTAAVATGAVFGVLSRGKYDDARNADTGQAAEDSRKTGDTFTTVGNITMIAGGVVVAGGLTWVLLSGGSSAEKSSALNLTLAPTGVRLGGSL